MWTTSDGYTLRLPHASLHTILSRMQPDDLRRLTGGTLADDPAPRIVRAVGRLARHARRSPEPGAAGGRLPVFSAPGYRMLVRPLGRREGEILLVAPGETGEGEVYHADDPNARKGGLRVRGSRVSIRWSSAIDLNTMRQMVAPKRRGAQYEVEEYEEETRQPARQKRGKGAAAPGGGSGGKSGGGRQPGAGCVYLVEEKVSGTWLPVYVGEAVHFTNRWTDRMRIFHELNLKADLSGYQVRRGDITPGNVQIVSPATLTTLREDVEHVLIREINGTFEKRGMSRRLTNVQSTERIRGAGLAVEIVNQPSSPTPFMRDVVTVAKDQVFELPWHGDGRRW